MSKNIVNDIDLAWCSPGHLPTISPAKTPDGGLQTVHNGKVVLPGETPGDVYAPATKGSGTPKLGGR